MGDQPVPVAVAVGGALNMAGLVGKDALGGGQGHRVFVEDGVVGAGFEVLGDIKPGVDGLGGDHHPVGGAPQPCQRVEFVVGQGREGLRPTSVLVRENRHHHSPQQHNTAGRVPVLHREGDVSFGRKHTQGALGALGHSLLGCIALGDGINSTLRELVKQVLYLLRPSDAVLNDKVDHLEKLMGYLRGVLDIQLPWVDRVITNHSADIKGLLNSR
jgi:hypothetical protein